MNLDRGHLWVGAILLLLWADCCAGFQWCLARGSAKSWDKLFPLGQPLNSFSQHFKWIENCRYGCTLPTEDLGNTSWSNPFGRGMVPGPKGAHQTADCLAWSPVLSARSWTKNISQSHSPWLTLIAVLAAKDEDFSWTEEPNPDKFLKSSRGEERLGPEGARQTEWSPVLSARSWTKNISQSHSPWLTSIAVLAAKGEDFSWTELAKSPTLGFSYSSPQGVKKIWARMELARC